MKKISKPIVFFGSGPVAANSLRLLAADFVIEAIITKPRPAHHRGDVPVIALAEELDIPYYTATDKRSLDELFTTHPVQSRIAVLIDFGIIVSQQIIDYFPLGIINSHFSILPEWRGADPITFAILSGQKQTGVSLMILTAGMDEGPLIGYGVQDIGSHTTTPELTADLITLSHSLLLHNLPRRIAGEAEAVPQDTTGRAVSYSRKLTKEDGIIDWSKPAVQLEREIRAFIEWPKSRTTLGGTDIIVTQARVADITGKPGERTIADKMPLVYCGEQSLVLERLKPAGKKEMTGEAFLAGYRQLFSDKT